MKKFEIRPPFQILLLLLLILAVYYPTLFAPLNSLDDQLFVNRLLNQNSFSLQHHFFPGGTSDYYRPLLTLTFDVDKYIGGLHESFMHFFNILIHALNTLLVFSLAITLGKYSGHNYRLPAFLAALFFGLHPINTEAVNWIAGRTDLLCGTFVFLSLLSLVKAKTERKVFYGYLGALLFLLAALFKETGLFLLPGVLLFCYWPLQRPKIVRWDGKNMLPVAYCVAALGYFLLRWSAFKFDRGITRTAEFITRNISSGGEAPKAQLEATSDLVAAATAILKTTGLYATKLIQPLPLNFAISRVDAFYIIPGLLLLIFLGYCLWRKTAVAMFVVIAAGIASSALLILFTRLAWTPIAERYMYIPAGIFSIALVFGFFNWGEKIRGRVVCALVVAAVTVFYGQGTLHRNFVWQDNLSLYQDTVQKSPDFAPAQNELAMALYAHGRYAEADAILESIRLPEGQLSSLNRATALVRSGRYPEARNLLLERVKKRDAKEVKALELLIKVTMGEANDSIDIESKHRYFRDVIGWLERLEEKTGNPFHWYRLGRIYLYLGEKTEAQRSFARAARGLPEDSVFYSPAVKLARTLLE